MPYQREAEIVLAMWREVEGHLSEAVAGSREEEYWRGEAARLRDEYQRLIREAEAHHRPVPPPFPENGEEPGTSDHGEVTRDPGRPPLDRARS